MTWLLDVNIDVRVKLFLSENGISCRTSQEMGWTHLANGKLVAAAVDAGLNVLLTRDNLSMKRHHGSLNCTHNSLLYW